MKRRLLPPFLTVLMCGFAGNLAAQDMSLDDQIQLFHQGVRTGCIYQFKTDPKLSNVPQDMRDQICTCVDNWFQSNNLNDEASVKANESVMPKVVMYCVQVAVGN